MTNKIEVTRICKINPEGSLKAFAEVLYNNAVLIKGLRIVDSEDGLFVAMPQEKGKNGKWYENVTITSKELQEEIEKTVLEAFDQ